MGPEERNGCARFDRRATRTSLNRNGHETAIAAKIEQLAAVRSPTRLNTTVDRYPGFRSRTGERLDVDLVVARLVRLVGDPSSIDRELALFFSGIRLREDDRRTRSSIAAKRQGPQIETGLLIFLVKHQVAPITRPVRWSREGR